MRCKYHLYDISSYIGVCASCLTERLSALIDAEAHMCSATFADDGKHGSHPPPRLLINRSIQPDGFQHDLVEASAKHPWLLPDQRFFSTPQFEISTASKTRKEYSSNNSNIRGKFSMITNLFKSKSKSKSQKFNTDKLHREDPFTAPTSFSASTPRWFPSLRRHSMSNQSTPDQAPIQARRVETSPRIDSLNSPSVRQTTKPPTKSASRRRSKSNTNVKEMIFGLSPLLRPSPNRSSSHKSYVTKTTSGYFTGKIRVPGKATMSASSSLRGSRSTNLADFS